MNIEKSKLMKIIRALRSLISGRLKSEVEVEEDFNDLHEFGFSVPEIRSSVEPMIIPQDMYMYVVTTDGQTFEIPFTSGTKIFFTTLRSADEWRSNSFHGCNFKSRDEQ